ncbi:MAG: 2-oxoacid:acceptor oxidoreductase family protein [Sphaerochaetaceae bacterium]|nr:2-oxoacid:acceptor oxidoreductase family protein [Sphaerochaetaceae bacterium]
MEQIKTSDVLYEEFFRKDGDKKITHYCPGCGHGTIQKMIAQAIEDLGIQDRVVFLSPVGCSVFSYYYFDTGNIQCSHGRAPAVGTAFKRVHEDSIVISYQGDGDLAGIGTAEIIHAANRGENMSVFFINNATYGMTGGQMAPTTLLEEKTLTSPFGRDRKRDGAPIKMAEMIATLDEPVLVSRVAVSSTKEMLKTKKMIYKALKNQVDNLGFSFVEILSACPTSWHVSPVEARVHIDETLSTVFPLGTFVDKADTVLPYGPSLFPFLSGEDFLVAIVEGGELAECEQAPLKDELAIMVAGFGGQGVLSGGVSLANAAIAHQLQVSWLPSYGPEMRGGKASVTVVMSPDEVSSPLAEDIDCLIALNSPSLTAYEHMVKPSGTILVNSSLIDHEPERDDVTVHHVPASDLAKEAGLPQATALVMISAYIHYSQVLTIDSLIESLHLGLKKKSLIGKNRELILKTVEILVSK